MKFRQIPSRASSWRISSSAMVCTILKICSLPLWVTLMTCGFGLRVKQALPSIVHRYPTSGFRRPFHGIANAFHSIPFCEAGRRLPAFYHRFDKLVGFDGFQFAVPNVHSGNVPGHFPVKMRGAGVDCLKAPSVVGVAGQTHLQLVESLVVEVEAAQSAVKLYRDEVVATPGVSRGLDAAYAPFLNFTRKLSSSSTPTA